MRNEEKLYTKGVIVALSRGSMVKRGEKYPTVHIVPEILSFLG